MVDGSWAADQLWDGREMRMVNLGFRIWGLENGVGVKTIEEKRNEV